VVDLSDPTPGTKSTGDFTIQVAGQRFDPLEAPAPRTPPQPATSQDRPARDPDADPADTRIVQFTVPLAAADIARLRATYGLALTVYVPNLAYVERVPPGPLADLRRDPLVRAIIDYLPEYKIEPSVAALPPDQPARL
jgi:hypothetical protein